MKPGKSSATAHRHSDRHHKQTSALQQWWLDRKYGKFYRPPSHWDYFRI